jgi:predicted transcriptional regulator
MTRKHRQGTYQEFKKFTLDVVKGKRRVDPNEPKIWVEATDDASVREIQFHSLEAGAKLLSAKNRALLRLIARASSKIRE